MVLYKHVTHYLLTYLTGKLLIKKIADIIALSKVYRFA
jgi:hypothetical protein